MPTSIADLDIITMRMSNDPLVDW